MYDAKYWKAYERIKGYRYVRSDRPRIKVTLATLKNQANLPYNNGRAA